MTTQPTAGAPKSSTIPVPLQEGEQVIKLCRRHWIYLWPQIVVFALLGLVPPIVLGILLDKAGGFHDIGGQIFWIASVLYLLYWLLRSLLAWYRYHHDIWAITNQRVIDVYRKHPLNLRIATADLVNVQDMTIMRDGLLRTMLNYGDIVCQTAAEQQDFRLIGIPDPADVQALVDKERDRERLRVRG